MIACHSHHTFEQIHPVYPGKTHFVPHTVPSEVYFPFTPEQKVEAKQKWIPNKQDWLVGFWSNRNARRKRPNDLIWAWSEFIKKLEKEQGHRKAVLLMHTDPFDSEGPHLLALRDHYGLEDNIVFSTERVGFDQLNEYYNLADFTINISHSEGFGLSTLESMMTGTPIVAPKTGGQTRQVVDYRDNTEQGVALPIEFQTMVGNQQIPYILEDYTSIPTIVEALWEMYVISQDEYIALKLQEKVLDYVEHEFKYENRIEQWDKLIEHTIHSWKSRYNRYYMEVL